MYKKYSHEMVLLSITMTFNSWLCWRHYSWIPYI